MRKNNNSFTILRYIIIILLVVAIVFPFYWIITTSFKTRLDINSSEPLFFFKPTLSNYFDAFRKADLFGSIIDSTLIGTGSVLLSILLGFPAAYGIARYKVGGGNFSFWILSTRMIPPVAMAIPMYMLFQNFSLLDTHLGLIFVYTLFNISYVVWMMSGFIKDIPKELDESAMIDGCNTWQVLLRIILPISKPGLVAVSIFCLIISWNEFLMALLLTAIDVKTVPVTIATFVTDREILWGQMTAAGVIAIVPVLIFSMIIQRHLVRGLTLGAVKE